MRSTSFTYVQAFACVVVVTVVAGFSAGCGAATQSGVNQTGSDSTVIAGAGESVPEIVTVVPDAGGGRLKFPEQNWPGMSKVASDAVPTAKLLPFAAAFPKSAGSPMAVYVSNPDAYPPGTTEVVEEFDKTSPYGAFRVREESRPAGAVDQSFIAGLPKMCVDCTDARLVQVEPGIQGALMVGAPRATSVTWLQGNYQMTVIGPYQLSGDTAIKISQEVAATFDKTAAESSQ